MIQFGVNYKMKQIPIDSGDKETVLLINAMDDMFTDKDLDNVRDALLTMVTSLLARIAIDLKCNPNDLIDKLASELKETVAIQIQLDLNVYQ